MLQRYLCLIFVLFSFLGKAQNIRGAGWALDFDGTDSVQVGSDYSQMTYPLSIAVWIRPNAGSGPEQTIFCSSDLSGVYQGWWFQVNSANRLSLSFGDGMGVGNPAFSRNGLAPFPSLQAGRWYHLAGVMRGPQDMSLYLNGNPLTVTYQGTGGNAMATNNSNGTIGQNTYNNWNLDAQIDELSIWDRDLSTAEVRDLMCAKLAGNEPGLRGYYRFDTANGGTLRDYSAQGNNGNLAGPPVWIPSSAPVGDRSNWNYLGNPAIEFSPNIDSAVATLNGTGDPGLHVYMVDQRPFPLPVSNAVPTSVNHYLGVFCADPNRSYNLRYYLMPPLTLNNTYGLARRPNNVAATWTALPPRNNPFIALNNRAAPEQLVIISDCPNYNPLPRDTTVCDSVRFNLNPSWTNITWNDGSTAASRAFQNPGTYWFDASDPANSCPVSDTVELRIINTATVDPLPDDTLVCGQGSVVLNAFGPNIEDYQWSNGSSDSATTFFTPGIKWVQVFFGGGCSVRDSILVRLSPEIEPLEKDTFLLCENQAVPLSVSTLDFINVLWSNGSSNFSTSYNTLGQHWVRAEKEDGCIESDTFYLQPGLGVDSLQLFADTLYCVDEPFVLRVPSPDIEVRWPNGSDSTYLVNRPQTIRVELSDGCRTVTEFFDVEPINCACDVIMPDAFTPNGDGLNDDFGPVSRCVYLEYELEIFNRWGLLVFSSQDPQERFDGTLNGEALAQGVYVYRLQYQTERSEGRRRGALTLVR